MQIFVVVASACCGVILAQVTKHSLRQSPSLGHHGTVVKGMLSEVYHFTGSTSCMNMRISLVQPDNRSWAILFTGKAKASSVQAVKYRFKSKHREEVPEFRPGI